LQSALLLSVPRFQPAHSVAVPAVMLAAAGSAVAAADEAEQPATLKRVQQRHGPTFANERCCTIHLDHGEPSAGGCDRVAFSCVGLLSNPQCVQFRLERGPIDDLTGSKFISMGTPQLSAC
jgi:hypothetical protein